MYYVKIQCIVIYNHIMLIIVCIFLFYSKLMRVHLLFDLLQKLIPWTQSVRGIRLPLYQVIHFYIILKVI